MVNMNRLKVPKNIVLVLVGLFLSISTFASERPPKGKVIQFSGIIHDELSGDPVVFATIYVKGEHRGTVSNTQGFFSFAVREGDTIVYRSIGYKTAEVVIPIDVEKSSYSVIRNLERDNLILDEVVIYPWPSKQLFRQAFLDLEVPDDLVELAKENFEKANLRDFNLITNYDGDENFDQFVKTYVGEVYYQGQSAPIQLLNPFAWAQFAQAVKRGDFKKK